MLTSRLIGRDPEPAMHGGGNTSLKSTARDLPAETLEVLHINGSGWDLATIEPRGLPVVRLASLKALRGRPALSDETIGRPMAEPAGPGRLPFGRDLAARLDPPPPCGPHRHVDHTHATAFLVLGNLPEVAAVTRAGMAVHDQPRGRA